MAGPKRMDAGTPRPRRRVIEGQPGARMMPMPPPKPNPGPPKIGKVVTVGKAVRGNTTVQKEYKAITAQKMPMEKMTSTRQQMAVAMRSSTGAGGGLKRKK